MGVSVGLVAALAAAVTVNSVGVRSGDPNAASANTAALRRLVSPTAYGGASDVGNKSVTFPDKAVYYFDDVIPFNDGISVDLMGSTLHFKKERSPRDKGSGFIFALRRFSLSNGRIEVDYDGTGVAGAGNALMLGQRWANGGSYFQPLIESQLKDSMGTISVSNVQIASNNPNRECGISLVGGLQDVHLSNISIDGEQALICGIYYEFGQATQPVDPTTVPKPAPPQTAHAHGMTFTGITVKNLNPHPPRSSLTIALALGGAYDSVVDGLTVSGVVDYVFLGTPGEAAFYRMWPKSIDAADRTITLRNITADRVHIAGADLGGTSNFHGGYLGKYLDPRSYVPADQRDQVNYILDGFNLAAAPGAEAWGIYADARSVDIRNGTVSGFQSGVLVTEDCMTTHIDHVNVLNSRYQGIRMDFITGNWRPPRSKTGYIKNSLIAGNGAVGVDSYAISLNWARKFVVENNTFKAAADAAGIPTQGGALILGPDAVDVLASNNNVVSIHGDVPAYKSVASADSGDTLQGAKGRVSSQGSWTTTR